MDLTPGFLFNGISLQVVSALIGFESTKVDASALPKTAIWSLSSFASDETDQRQDEMAFLRL